MTRLRQVGMYLLLVCMLVLMLWAAFPEFWRDCVTSALSGSQEQSVYRAAVGSGGGVSAVVRRGESWRLVRGDVQGQRSEETLLSLGLTDVVTVSGLYECGDGGLLLAAYTESGGLRCGAYYIGAGETAARTIFSAACPTGELWETRIWGMSEEGGAVSFVVTDGTEVGVYQYTPGEESAHRMSDETDGGEECLYGLPDGQMVRASELALPEGIAALRGWRQLDGSCVLDGVEGALWQVSRYGEQTRMLVLDEVSEDVVDVSVSPDGRAALLTEGGRLLVWWDGTVQDYSWVLSRPRWQSIAILAASGVGVLAAGLALVWFLLVLRKMQLPLVARKGVEMAVVLGILTAGGIQLWVEPYYASRAEAEAVWYLQRQAETSERERQAGWYGQVTQSDSGLAWSDGEQALSVSGLTLGGAYRQGVEEALAWGQSQGLYDDGGVPRYVLFTRESEETVKVVSVLGTVYLEQAALGAGYTAGMLWTAAWVSLALLVAVLVGLARSFRRVTRGMAALCGGEGFVEVIDRRGDEVSALAEALNTLARDLRTSRLEESRLSEVYARFVPRQILELLGVDRVEQIDKQTFASREMVTMHVSFSFDERVYESRSRELFNNINEVTELASRVVSAQGGTIFSFSHEGFDALFASGTAAPISAAVAIRGEILSANEARRQAGLPPVGLHITLDSGEVLVGVVGDETRMQATAVSSSFNTTRMLDALFSRFEANILCTERIERWAEGYGSRYIGKTHDGSERIRVYELYDGDPPQVRQGKSESGARFAEGIFTLSTGDAGEAKRIFMEIVRENSMDGVARYYLYLADRISKESVDEVCLDM